MLVFAVGGQGGFSWQRYELKAKFPNVQGLKSGAMVRVAGVDVGQVTDVEFVGSDVQVTLGVGNEKHVAHHGPVARIDRLAEPARRADHRDQSRRARARR